MAKFVEMPHGYAFNVEEVLYYQVLYGDTYNPDIDYNKYSERDCSPIKLLIHFKNGDDLEIPDFEQFFLKDLWKALNSLESQSIEQPLEIPPIEDYTTNSGIYFIQGEITKRIKIGFSKQIDQRIKGLQTSEHLRLIGVIPNVSTDMESSLHSKFSHLRVLGEWFEGSQELIQYINSLRSDKNTTTLDETKV